MKKLFATLWPTLFGPQPAEEEVPVERIELPPAPMYKAPDDSQWSPL